MLLDMMEWTPMSAAAVWEYIARNWAMVGISATIAVLTVIPWVILRKYIRIALNLMDDAAPPVWPESRETPPMDGASVSFSAFDGHSLRGTMLRSAPSLPKKGAIIFAHEFGSDRRSYYRHCEPLRAAGYDVFAFDFRGHGDSLPEEGYRPRQFPSDREQSDMLGAIAYVEDLLEREGRPRDVGLFGLSRGAGAALVASVDLQSVKAIVVDGAYSSDATLEFFLKRWANIFAKLRFVYENHPRTFWRFLRWMIFRKAQRVFRCRFPSVRKAIRRLGSVPLLFIHGERDTFIPPEQARMLHDIATGPKDLWIVPCARHNQSVVVQPPEYARRIVAFFDRHLAAETSKRPNVETSKGRNVLTVRTNAFAGAFSPGRSDP